MATVKRENLCLEGVSSLEVGRDVFDKNNEAFDLADGLLLAGVVFGELVDGNGMSVADIHGRIALLGFLVAGLRLALGGAGPPATETSNQPREEYDAHDCTKYK